MRVGGVIKKNLEFAFNQLGKTVGIYNDISPGSLPSFEIRALQETKIGKGVFEFLERQDISRGSIIRVKGAKDLWRVIDTEDEIEDDTYIMFKAHVEKVDESGKQVYVNNEGGLVINAPVQGGIQVGGSHNVQNVFISVNPKFDESVNSILEFIDKDTILDEYQKEDAVEALQKLPELAKKEQNDKVMKRAKEKLEFVKSVISVSNDLAIITGPYLLEIARHFHLIS